MTWLWVALAGGVGAVLRHLTHAAAHRVGRPSSLATLAVNGVGSFLIGVLHAPASGIVPPEVATVLAVGLLGGFTTFSTASVESAELWRDGRPGAAAGLAAVMLAACLGAAALGVGVGMLVI